MTKKIFWQDPYLNELRARVTSVAGAVVRLDQTIFYAFSGGQESDAGTIGGFVVVRADKADNFEIDYTLADGHTLKVGDEVDVRIDSARRLRLMRLHFAAELVLELICQKYPSTEKVGAHISADKARIDFEWPDNIAKILPDIQSGAQKIIDSHREVVSAFSDEASQRRYWKIDDFSQVPCGGTHIKNTREIGSVRLKRVNPGKGRERVEIYVD